MNRDFRGDNRPRETRVNERIRAREVRLIDEDGQMIGVMSSMQALGLARERNLDLVEVSPMASPPVCKLMDYGRFKYEQAKKENEARKHQKTSELKEIRMRPRTDDHDLTVKVRKIEEFLGDGDKVKVGVIFRGRELAHMELGRRLLDRVIAELKAAAVLERPPLVEGKMMSMIMTRAPGWEPPKKAAPEPRGRKDHVTQDDVEAQLEAHDDDLDADLAMDDETDEQEIAAPEIAAPAVATPEITTPTVAAPVSALAVSATPEATLDATLDATPMVSAPAPAAAAETQPELAEAAPTVQPAPIAEAAPVVEAAPVAKKASAAATPPPTQAESAQTDGAQVDSEPKVAKPAPKRSRSRTATPVTQ
ncbi:MAG TPA: translation initiation factor IF-3 [Ktedonobacterales bacterium]|nr:translation initiation factor IF-3 [Ktedonobacterales bacterium]